MRGASTHWVTVADGLVVKRFRSYVRGEHLRERRGLCPLNRYAPGQAPSGPLRPRRPAAVRDDDPARRDPLGSAPLDARLIAGIAAALAPLHSAVPVRTLVSLQPCTGHPCRCADPARSRLAGRPGVRTDPVITAAVAAGRRWLGSAEARRLSDVDAAPGVLGRNDHHSPNFLPDGGPNRLVDFQDSGRTGSVNRCPPVLRDHWLLDADPERRATVPDSA